MPRMLGRQVWYGVFCSCCNGPRSVKAEKAREGRRWRRELLPEGLLPHPLDDPTACVHDCNGECLIVEYGSYGETAGCSFICHQDDPVGRAEWLCARAELAAEIWPGGSRERTHREQMTHP